jgi:hypothetical protein
MVLQWNMLLNQFYNQMMMNKINNQNQFDIWINQGNNNKYSDRLPNMKQSVIADLFSQMPGPKANLIFQTVKGYKVTIPAPLNIPMHQVLGSDKSSCSDCVGSHHKRSHSDKRCDCSEIPGSRCHDGVLKEQDRTHQGTLHRAWKQDHGDIHHLHQAEP